MLLEIRRENTIDETGAIPGRLYVNGNFFAYTLENAAKNICKGNSRFPEMSKPFLI